MNYTEYLRKVLGEGATFYEDEDIQKALEGKGSIRCRFLLNWSLKKNQTCRRSSYCKYFRDNPRDLRCPLVLVKIAAEVIKKHWWEEVLRQ